MGILRSIARARQRGIITPEKERLAKIAAEQFGNLIRESTGQPVGYFAVLVSQEAGEDGKPGSLTCGQIVNAPPAITLQGISSLIGSLVEQAYRAGMAKAAEAKPEPVA